jgi:FAD/FMN-containing dehydrogenase
VARRYASWGRFPDAPPGRVVRVDSRGRLPELPAPAGPYLPYGLGRSYGDVCLNGDATILDTAGLDRFIHFDRETGVLRAEAGVALADVIALAVPAGWFLPVSPGTKWVTLGGAVANDVHGKNHHVAGTFGRHVRRLELARSDGSRQELEPGDELFAATVAGLGLTGLITWVEFQLQPIRSGSVEAIHTPFRSLDEFAALSAEANARSPYVVGWVDTLRPEGRGVLIEGRHAERGSPAKAVSARPARLRVPFDAPAWALSRPAVRALNAAYFAIQARAGRHLADLDSFFYPLDVIADWNRGYGKRGLLQHQCLVPAMEHVRVILKRVASSGAGSFLAVLKTFGDVPSPGMLSFPRPGVTLALDFAHRGRRTIDLLHSLDQVVLEAGGRVYPAKDACMAGASFRSFYPNWSAFAQHIDPSFSSSFWRRVTSDA